jgi:hypothetical protein
MAHNVDPCTPNDNPALWHRIYARDDEVRIKRKVRLPVLAHVSILPSMFMVSEEAATAIRAIFEKEGELSAAIELRRLFPGVIDNARVRECARSDRWVDATACGSGQGHPSASSR